MLGYVMVGTNDLARAEAFYRPVLDLLGMGKNDRFGGERSAWFSTGDPSGGMFAVTRPGDEQPATVGNGTMVALTAPSRAVVDQAHGRALDLGGVDEGAPGPRGDSGFYAAYFRDLDGNKLCVFHFGPA